MTTKMKHKKAIGRFLFNLFITLCITGVLGVAPLASAKDVAKEIKTTEASKYTPSNIYQGGYLSKALYYRHNKKQNWMRCNKSENYIEHVKCPAALLAFSLNGYWIGNFEKNWDCGTTVEPAIYATGNYLNHDSNSEITKHK